MYRSAALWLGLHVHGVVLRVQTPVEQETDGQQTVSLEEESDISRLKQAFGPDPLSWVAKADQAKFEKVCAEKEYPIPSPPTEELEVKKLTRSLSMPSIPSPPTEELEAKTLKRTLSLSSIRLQCKNDDLGITPADLSEWTIVMYGSDGIDNYIQKNKERFFELARRGIPDKFRWKAWVAIAKSRSPGIFNADITEQLEWNIDETFNEQILKDVKRIDFPNKASCLNLSGILYAYAGRNKELVYQQGMHDIADFLLKVQSTAMNPVEPPLKEAFSMFVYMMEIVGLTGIFARNGFPLLHKYKDAVKPLFLKYYSNQESIVPHLEALNYSYFHRWLMLLSSRALPFQSAVALWDSIIVDGLPVILSTMLSYASVVGYDPSVFKQEQGSLEAAYNGCNDVQIGQLLVKDSTIPRTELENALSYVNATEIMAYVRKDCYASIIDEIGIFDALAVGLLFDAVKIRKTFRYFKRLAEVNNCDSDSDLKNWDGHKPKSWFRIFMKTKNSIFEETIAAIDGLRESIRPRQKGRVGTDERERIFADYSQKLKKFQPFENLYQKISTCIHSGKDQRYDFYALEAMNTVTKLMVKLLTECSAGSLKYGQVIEYIDQNTKNKFTDNLNSFQLYAARKVAFDMKEKKMIKDEIIDAITAVANIKRGVAHIGAGEVNADEFCANSQVLSSFINTYKKLFNKKTEVPKEFKLLFKVANFIVNLPKSC